MAISKRLRYEILRRDNHTCRYCGASAPDVPLRVDHVIPKALGGSDEPSNLVAACEPCNSGKTSSAPDAATIEDVRSDALRWAAAMERAADIQADRDRRAAEQMAIFDETWRQWSLNGGEIPRPSNWEQSIKTLMNHGLNMFEAAGAPNPAPEPDIWAQQPAGGQLKDILGDLFGRGKP